VSKFIRAACGALFIVLVVQTGLAQLSTATLFGTVVDTSGAAIPDATIVLTQTLTAFTRVTKSNALGEYRAEFLPVGPYTVKVNAASFQEIVQNGIVLTATQEAALNYSLLPGGESSVVTVTSEVPLVNLGNSELGSTVDNRQIDNLQLVGRDVYGLLNLTPGVQNVQNENSIGLPMEHVIINGSSDNMVGQVTYYLDGGINMTGVRDTGNVYSTDCQDFAGCVSPFPYYYSSTNPTVRLSGLAGLRAEGNALALQHPGEPTVLQGPRAQHQLCRRL
jgi:hypothetical protein